MWIIKTVKGAKYKLFTKLSTVYTEMQEMLQKSYSGIHKHYKNITNKLQKANKITKKLQK